MLNPNKEIDEAQYWYKNNVDDHQLWYRSRSDENFKQARDYQQASYVMKCSGTDVMEVRNFIRQMPNARNINVPDFPIDSRMELIGFPYISLVSTFKNCVNILVRFASVSL